MSSPNPIAQLLFTDHKIILCQSTIKPLGGLAEAVLFAQLAYWSERAKDSGAIIDGERWAFRTQEQLEEETGLTPFQQRGARVKLAALGVLEERRHGIPAKLYYRVNFAAFCDLLNVSEPEPDVEKLHNSKPKKSTSLKGSSEIKRKDGTPDGVSESAPKKKREPSGPAQEIVEAYCQKAGIERPVSYGQAVGLAQKMADAGITSADIGPLYDYVADWADGVDLALMFKQADKWRASRKQAVDKPKDILDGPRPNHHEDLEGWMAWGRAKAARDLI